MKSCFSCLSISRASGKRSAGWISIALLVALLGAPTLAPAEEQPGSDIAVVVHPGVSVDDLSFAELRKILRGDRRFWRSAEPITLLVRAPVAIEREVLLRKIYKMGEAQFRQYWIAKVFRAQATTGPKVVLSNEMAVELVQMIEGSIALMSTDEIPEGAKVLSIDGHLPADSDYPLR